MACSVSPPGRPVTGVAEVRAAGLAVSKEDRPLLGVRANTVLRR